MASSSSYSPCNYDVFLSFRGEDTRRTIVSHLYAALDGKGINTFKDNLKLEMGDHISDELHRAIQGSNFAVVVLSENYATSKWCLMELQLIMESYKLGETKVFPIFYGVDPSDVRKQAGKFCLERYQDSSVENKVPEWTDALFLVAGLSGVDSRDRADEAMMVKDIVEDISSQLASMQPPPLDDVFGVEAQHVKPLLKIESHREVSMIGIWGMGGVGKTTIARYLYEQLGRRFPAHCFIANVDQTFKGDNLGEVQQQFLCDILHSKKVRKITSVQSGAKLIQSRLANLKVFVVLDGVEKVEQLNALAKETSWFGQGSRIIITTRDKRLLDSCRVTNIHEVRCLESEESLKMLKHFAFEGGVPPDDAYEGLAIRASQLARGLPFALEAFGLYLRGKSSIGQWEDALDKLETYPPRDIHDVLLRSYASLDTQDKTNFLRVACLFNGEHHCSVSALLSVRDTSIKALADKSLIHITNEGFIDMHSLIQQMGREIVLKESKYISQKQAILWDPLNSYHVLKRNTGTKKMEGMALHMCELPTPLASSPINGSAFNQMHNLIFLKFFKHLDDMGSKLDLISDNCIVLPRSLRLLHWDAYPLTTLPPKLPLDCLVEVHLRYSNLESLWDGNPSLFELRVLDVTGSKNLTKLPNISLAPKLEELIAKGCTRLEQIPGTIGSLPSLKKLDVSLCDRLINLQMGIGELPASRKRSPGIFRQVAVDFPDFVESLNSLTDVSFQGKVNFWMPHLWGKATHISFSSEQRIPNEFVTEPGTMSDFYGFKSLDIKRFNYKNDGAPFQCHSFSKFPCLTELNLINLNIKSIPVDIGLLQELQKLDLSGNDFTYLPTEMENLSKLKSLALCNCTEFQVLPQLTQLESLELSDCTCLTSLLDPSAANENRSRYLLQKLWLDNCKNVGRLSDRLSRCTNLTHLDLSGNDMVTMPTSIRYLRLLGTLCLNDCTKLKFASQIPSQLTYLYARGGTSLETIYLPSDHSLKHVDLSYCPRLNGVEDLINEFLTRGRNNEVSQRFACLHGSKVPSYFDNQATILTQIPHTSEFVGFDACIIIACESPFHLKLSSFSYSCKQEDNGSYRLNIKPDFFIPSESATTSSSYEGEAVSDDHMFIFHIPGNIDVHEFRLEPHLEFSEEFQFKPARIISSKVRVIPKTQEHDITAEACPKRRCWQDKDDESKSKRTTDCREMSGDKGDRRSIEDINI